MRSFVNSVLVHVAGMRYICTDTAVRQAGTFVGIVRTENNYLTYPTIMYDHCDVMLLTRVLP